MFVCVCTCVHARLQDDDDENALDREAKELVIRQLHQVRTSFCMLELAYLM